MAKESPDTSLVPACERIFSDAFEGRGPVAYLKTVPFETRFMNASGIRSAFKRYNSESHLHAIKVRFTDYALTEQQITCLKA